MEKHGKTILGIVTIMYWFSLYTYVPYIAPYMGILGSSATLAGLVVGSYGFAQVILRIPVGITADMLSRQKIFVILGVAFNSIASFCMWLIPGPYAMLVGRFLSGVAASMWVCYTTLYSSYYEKGETTKALGNINALNNFGKFTASMLGGMVAQQFGITAPFALSFIIAGIAVILSLFVTDIKVDREPLKFIEIIKVGKDKTLLFSCILSSLAQMIIFATAFSFISNLAKEKNASDLELGIIATLFTFGMLVASFMAGRGIIAKIGEKRALMIGFITIGLYCVIAPFVPNVFALYILQFLGGCGNGLLFTLIMSMAVKKIDPAKRSTAMGFYQAIYGIGMTIGPAIMGVLVDYTGFTMSFISMGGISIIAMLMILFLYNRYVGAYNGEAAQ